ENIRAEKNALREESEKLKAQGQFLEIVKQQRMELLTSREKTLDVASAIVKRNSAKFAAGKAPATFTSLGAALQNSKTIALDGNNPFVKKMTIDWGNEKVLLSLYSDIAELRQKLDQGATQAQLRDQADQLLYNEIAAASRQSGEEISPFQNQFEIHLSKLT